MTMEQKYSAQLTGAAFNFFEFKQVVNLKMAGYTDKEIREKVLNENLFQHPKTTSVKRVLPSIIKRVNVLDDVLLQLVKTEPIDTGKMINLYTIMKTDRLFFEFMDEVIREKFESNNYLLEKKDVNSFFTEKGEQHEVIANWTENTVNKLKQVFTKILLETGILKDKKTWELLRPFIDGKLKEHLLYIGEREYLRAIGE